jgi:penicillin amidase
VLKLIRVLAATTVVLIVAVAGGSYFYMRASLPTLDGEMSVAGLVDEVQVQRDDRGIPTIRAASRAAVAYGTGFAHAQDRYFQMDLLRRQSAGELSALVGAAALSVDKRLRLHRFRHRAGQVLARLPEEQRRYVDAYTDGVNAGLDSLRARPLEYAILGAEPTPWQPEDSFLVVFSMFLELNDARASRDLARGYAKLALPASQFAWMYPPGTSWDAPLLDDEPLVRSMPGPDIVDLRAATVRHPFVETEDSRERALAGSNNWAVGGALTSDGRAIVANDMHLGIDAPNIWYRARLQVTGADAMDVSGVTLPGTPAVITGSNGHVAWAFTNSFGDWTDAVVVRPGAARNTYRTPDGDREVETYVERIEIRDGADQSLVVRETIWGPIVDDVDYPDGEIAVSWIAHHTDAVNFGHFALEQARSVEDAIAAANRAGIPPQNFVVGDADGNIGWTIAGQIPARGSAPADVPGDWSDGQGWQGWLAPEAYPRVVNPPSGRIWTANARVASGDNLRKVGDGGYDLAARQRQIRDALLAGERFDVDDMLAIHLDDRAIFLGRWRELLLTLLDAEAIAENPARAEFRRLVDGWSARAAADDVGYRLVRGFRMTVRDRVFDMLTAPIVDRFGSAVPRRRSNQFEGPLWELVNERPAHMLTSNYADWRGLMLDAVDELLAYFEENYGDGLDRRTWGERNTGSFRHPLSPALPVVSALLDLPADRLPGDSDMPRVQGRSFGASERFAVSPGNERAGYLHMPGGQSGHPLSPHYDDGHRDWVTGRASPFMPGPAIHRLTLRPAR